MGGVETAVFAGIEGKNLIDRHNEIRADIKNTRKKMKYNIRNKKNLLDEQLATRRASLGALGISSSPSSLAYDHRMMSNAYLDIAQDNTDYRKKLNTLHVKSTSNLLNSGKNIATDMMPTSNQQIY